MFPPPQGLHLDIEALSGICGYVLSFIILLSFVYVFIGLGPILSPLLYSDIPLGLDLFYRAVLSVRVTPSDLYPFSQFHLNP